MPESYNQTERRLNYFAKEGGDARATLDPDFIRFPIVYKWQNTRGGPKTIDLTAITFSGRPVAIEAKQSTKQRWSWNQIKDNQRALLDKHVELGALAFLWLGFVEPDKKSTPIAYYLIPWTLCKYMQDNVMRGNVPYKSVTIGDLDELATPHKLHAEQVKRSGRWDWQFFTKRECQMAQFNRLPYPEALDFERSYLS